VSSAAGSTQRIDREMHEVKPEKVDENTWVRIDILFRLTELVSLG
jgi:hypothetical protein